MRVREWFDLNKRVRRLERLMQKLEQENVAIMTIPFIEPSLEEFEGEVVRGREIEEDENLLDAETVEEREYREESKWLSQRKQKERLT